MKIDITLLNSLSTQVKANPRPRQAYDLRTTPEDNSQREVANALYQKLGFERKDTNCYTKKIFYENNIQ